MAGPDAVAVVERSDLRNRSPVFRDRRHAGEVLAGMLGAFRGGDALLLAIPAGGVPVAAEVAAHLELELDVAVVSKITLPWNTEAGYGAVAWDGTVRINRSLAAQVGLDSEQIRAGVAQTEAKVRQRVARLRVGRRGTVLDSRPVILVDDGLASGFTMLVAVEAVAAAGADRVVVAVPTGPADTVARIAKRVEAVFCANVREGRPFAVADAYERWSDVDEDEAAGLLAAATGSPAPRRR